MNIDKSNKINNNIEIKNNIEDTINSHEQDYTYCINCGKKGHYYKKCLYPIISIGIICLKFNKENLNINLNQIINYSKKIQNNYLFSIEEINKLKILKQIIINLDLKNFDDNIEYLMIRRKNSLNYIEFIRGKYDFNNIEYLENIINLLSKEEKELLLNKEFNELWNDLWNDNKKKSNEYKDAQNKFNLLKKGTIIKKNDINIKINLHDLLTNNLITYEDPEWGFPKGRRNYKEKNIDCAKREFEEETNLKSNDYHILNMSPLEETYLSTNSSKYKHIYYISQCQNKNLKLLIDEENENMKTEIGDIKWLKINDALNIIRDYHIDKKTKLVYLHHMIKNTILNFKDILNEFLEFL